MKSPIITTRYWFLIVRIGRRPNCERRIIRALKRSDAERDERAADGIRVSSHESQFVSVALPMSIDRTDINLLIRCSNLQFSKKKEKPLPAEARIKSNNESRSL